MNEPASPEYIYKRRRRKSIRQKGFCHVPVRAANQALDREYFALGFVPAHRLFEDNSKDGLGLYDLISHGPDMMMPRARLGRSKARCGKCGDERFE